ncbi:MAG: family 78 glycoside hydrolase catalytic domain, partial [Parasporobacterium sp.]|nr:family 78 glycoside hydrolase catalytic domain [Parasporobacterium sp.]
SARLYITACGLYEACINGRRAGDFVLAPGYTDYKKRIQYQVYDVTDLIKEGTNEITCQLADGWYRGSTGAWGILNQYGTRTKLLAQLEITLADGSIQAIASDGSWQWSADGPITFADNQDGETVDAGKIPSYSGKALEVSCDVVPTCSNNVPICEHETFKPTLITTPSGKTVLDTGQNIAGYAAFKINAKAGQKIKLRFGELLDDKGEFTQVNIQCANKKKTTPLQQVIYTCKEGMNEYKTSFAIFGFQYILVESEAPFSPEDFTAIAVYSDLEDTLKFNCSNELLNKFVECTRWSAKNNSADVPTDCPTRERHGWTGDIQIFFTTAGYLFNYAPFIKKFLNDMLDEQRPNGCFRQISPNGGVDFYMQTMDGSPGWSDAGVLLPYRLYKMFGEKAFLEEHYDALKRYAQFIMKRCGGFTPIREHIALKGKAKKYFVNKGQSYGEWAEPKDVCAFVWTDFVNPHPDESTAYARYLFTVMAEIAELTGHTEDIALYNEYAEGCRYAYQEYVKLPKSSLDTDRQAKLVRPLYFNLLTDEQTDYAKKRLIKALDNYGWRVGTGFLSTPLILYVLAEIDIDYAYKLLENEELPGWLCMPKLGATTIWEGWEGPSAQGGISSLNHYSKGAVCEWVFSEMCGIKVAGENCFNIAPLPGGHLGHAFLEYDSIYGKVTSSWEKKDGKYTYKIRIPSNCTAKVIIDGIEKELGPGGYEF